MPRNSWLDGKHVVFGKVIQGMDTVYEIENTPTDSSNRPLTSVWIAECGQLNNAGLGGI